MNVRTDINSYSHIIQLGMLDRMRLIAPFIGAARFARSRARAIRPEHIPLVGCYLMEEGLGPDGEPAVGEPRFRHRLTLAFSYIIQDNDTDEIEDMLDVGHWAVMGLLHDPNWHHFPALSDRVRIEGITGGNRSHHFGNLGANQNETPIAEMRMELYLTYCSSFEPYVSDIFETFHMETSRVPPYPPDGSWPPITIETDLWPTPTQNSP
jgi:hypothetical protein